MKPQEFMEVLQEAIILDMEETGSRITAVDTLKEAGLMGNKVGLVLHTDDGSVFRVLIEKIDNN
ncbi:MAG: hypothetical protein ACOYU3_02635 [Bacillota bacterium]